MKIAEKFAIVVTVLTLFACGASAYLYRLVSDTQMVPTNIAYLGYWAGAAQGSVITLVLLSLGLAGGLFAVSMTDKREHRQEIERGETRKEYWQGRDYEERTQRQVIKNQQLLNQPQPQGQAPQAGYLDFELIDYDEEEE